MAYGDFRTFQETNGSGNEQHQVVSPQSVLASPATAGTVSANNNARDQILYITPAGTIATLTINLPSDATSRIGQKVTIVTTQIVTAVTLASASASFLNTLTAATANGATVYQKVASGVWAKISGV